MRRHVAPRAPERPTVGLESLPPLRDRLAPALDALFVGINPGVRSALTGHHFAGYSNRFWKLLHESGNVPERLTYEDDDRLPSFGLGITNLVSRATPGVGDLSPAELRAGRAALERKIRRFRPRLVVLVGVTVCRAVFERPGGGAPVISPGAPNRVIGLRPERLAGAPVFVVPNPSGRNANFRYEEMLDSFRELRDVIVAIREGSRK